MQRYSRLGQEGPGSSCHFGLTEGDRTSEWILVLVTFSWVRFWLKHAALENVPLEICTSGHKWSSSVFIKNRFLWAPYHLKVLFSNYKRQRFDFFKSLARETEWIPACGWERGVGGWVGAVSRAVQPLWWVAKHQPVLVLDQSAIRSYILEQHEERHATITVSVSVTSANHAASSSPTSSSIHLLLPPPSWPSLQIKNVQGGIILLVWHTHLQSP